MSRPRHTVAVDNGKYTFVNRNGLVIDILRYGDLMAMEYRAPKAIAAIMCELDASRVVLESARTCLAINELNGRGDFVRGLAAAIKRHDALTGDCTPPSAWASDD